MADPIRLIRIDESNIGAHFHLRPDDECYFLFEYTSGLDYSFSATNSLISNLKKKPTQSGKHGYHYKARAVGESSRYLAGAINPEWLKTATIVPVPCSKAIGHPDYDDRMTRICRGVRPAPPLDVRELVVQSESLTSAHEAEEGQRPTVEELLRIYRTNEALSVPVPTAIGIFDDVLTAGVHYRAMHTVLSQRFPNVPIIGVFIARRVFANPFDK